jgi:hypothetical protein
MYGSFVVSFTKVNGWDDDMKYLPKDLWSIGQAREDFQYCR